jgi:hypothetical protein
MASHGVAGGGREEEGGALLAAGTKGRMGVGAHREELHAWSSLFVGSLCCFSSLREEDERGKREERRKGRRKCEKINLKIFVEKNKR